MARDGAQRGLWKYHGNWPFFHGILCIFVQNEFLADFSTIFGQFLTLFGQFWDPPSLKSAKNHPKIWKNDVFDVLMCKQMPNNLYAKVSGLETVKKSNIVFWEVFARFFPRSVHCAPPKIPTQPRKACLNFYVCSVLVCACLPTHVHLRNGES